MRTRDHFRSFVLKNLLSSRMRIPTAVYGGPGPCENGFLTA
jgi:hypothetical protein